MSVELIKRFNDDKLQKRSHALPCSAAEYTQMHVVFMPRGQSAGKPRLFKHALIININNPMSPMSLEVFF